MSNYIQIASDLHLEFEEWSQIEDPPFEKIIDPCSEILVLAGDIGNPETPVYRKFLEWCVSNFGHVLLTPGNHEYYHRSVGKGNSLLEEMCRETGVVFLQQKSFSIPSFGMTFIGATMWSHIPPEDALETLLSVNDFKKIEGMTCDAYNELHDEHRQWLIDELGKVDPSHRKIVVTHHSPLLETTSHPMYRGKKTNCAFQSDLSSIMTDYSVDVWFFGHTHYSVDFYYHETRVVANQKGYPSEKRESKYSPEKRVEVGLENIPPIV